MPSGGTQQAAGDWHVLRRGQAHSRRIVTVPGGVKESTLGEKREWAESRHMPPFKRQSRLTEEGGAMKTELNGGEVSVTWPGKPGHQ